MFKPMIYVDVSDGASGMLIPVLSLAGTNLPYVQRMDEHMRVKEVVPFLDYENYPTVPADDDREITVGGEGLIAFRSFDGSIISGNSSEIISYIHTNRSVIAQQPILHAQLQRIEVASFTASYDVWREVATILFPSEPQRKLWIESEHLLFQRRKQIWMEIEHIGTRRDSYMQEGLSDEISRYGAEELFGWLINRRNFLKENWTKEWHRLRALEPFDKRVLELAVAWMFHLAAEHHDLRQMRSVLSSFLETTSDKYNTELGEFLSDTFSSEPSLLFEFLRPKRLLSQLLNAIVAYGDIEQSIKVLEFGIEHLPKEEFIINALRSALDDVDESDPGTAPYIWRLSVKLYPYTQEYVDRDHRTGADAELIDLEKEAIELISDATSFGKQERYETAYAVLNFALLRFGTATELPLRAQVAVALLAKAEMLRRERHWELAVAVCDDLLERFASAPELSLRIQVAAALRAKAACLRANGEDDDDAYRKLITRFGGALEEAVREHVAEAMLSKAKSEYEPERAIEIYEEFFDLFGTTSRSPMGVQVTKAFKQLRQVKSLVGDDFVEEQDKKLLKRIKSIYGRRHLPRNSKRSGPK